MWSDGSEDTSDDWNEEQKLAFYRGDYVSVWRNVAIYLVISLGIIAFVTLIVWHKIYDSGIE